MFDLDKIVEITGAQYRALEDLRTLEIVSGLLIDTIDGASASPKVRYLVDQVAELVTAAKLKASEATAQLVEQRDILRAAAAETAKAERRGEIREALRGALTATRPRRVDPEEAKAAELLDQALQARHESLTASSLHEDYKHPDAVAADEREKEAATALLALDPMYPAATAAQFAYLCVDGESGESVFEGSGGRADWLDFAAVEEYVDHLPIQQVAAKLVAEYLRTHADSPVAAVIARHRALGINSPPASIAAE